MPDGALDNVAYRQAILATFGATFDQIDELSRYNDSAFDHSAVPPIREFPLPDEQFIDAWQEYANDTTQTGAFGSLRRRCCAAYVGGLNPCRHLTTMRVCRRGGRRDDEAGPAGPRARFAFVAASKEGRRDC